MIPNKTEHFVTVFNDQVVTVNKGWLYGLTKLKQLSLAHNQVCPLLLQQDALALPCLLQLIMISLLRSTTSRTMDGTSAQRSGNSTSRATRFNSIIIIMIINIIKITIITTKIIILLIFVHFSSRLLRGTSCVGCQVSPTSISGDDL